MLADKNQIKKAASAFSKREKLIEEAEERLLNQAQDMEKAVIEITSDVDTAVSAHFNTSSMQTTLKTQAVEVFTKICDEKNPGMINRLEGTAKEILTNDVWVTKHIQAIATETVA